MAGAAQPGTGRNARALPYAEALRLRAAELRLEGQVEFLGERDDVPQLLRAADGFVLSSAWEGMPNAVMEAMAAALPVVATDVGDVPELVEDRTSGFVVQPGDSEALADRMLSLMAMPPDQRRAMGERGLERIRARFENERVVDEWEALFRRLVNRNVPDHILPVQHAPAP